MTIRCITDTKITDYNQWRTQDTSERCQKMLKSENKTGSVFHATFNIPGHRKTVLRPMLDCLKCHKQDLIRPFSLRNPSIRGSEQMKNDFFFEILLLVHRILYQSLN